MLEGLKVFLRAERRRHKARSLPVKSDPPWPSRPKACLGQVMMMMMKSATRRRGPMHKTSVETSTTEREATINL